MPNNFNQPAPSLKQNQESPGHQSVSSNKAWESLGRQADSSDGIQKGWESLSAMSDREQSAKSDNDQSSEKGKNPERSVAPNERFTRLAQAAMLSTFDRSEAADSANKAGNSMNATNVHNAANIRDLDDAYDARNARNAREIHNLGRRALSNFRAERNSAQTRDARSRNVQTRDSRFRDARINNPQARGAESRGAKFWRSLRPDPKAKLEFESNPTLDFGVEDDPDSDFTGANGVRIQGTSAEIEFLNGLKLEEVRTFDRDRSKDNFEMIRQHNPHLARVYSNLVADYPQLKNVALKDGHNISGFAGCNTLAEQPDGQYLTTVEFDFSHPDAYIKSNNKGNSAEGEAYGLARTIKLVALKIGARPEDMMQDRDLVNAFLLCHEMGHALDFRVNYLDPELEKAPRGPKVQAIAKAAAKNYDKRQRDQMTQPIPGYLKEGRKRSDLVHTFRNRLAVFGVDVNNQRELMNFLERTYREMPSEAYADNFATNFILSHYGDYFEAPQHPGLSFSNFGNFGKPTVSKFDRPAAPNASGKIRTCIGETIDISRDADLLGMVPSKAMRFTRLEPRNGKFFDRHDRPYLVTDEEPEEAFLGSTVTPGQPIHLFDSGDPERATSFWTADVDRVYIHPTKGNQYKIENQIVLSIPDEEGPAYYLAEFLDKKPVEVDIPPQKMFKDLHLDTHAKVQLINRRRHRNYGAEEGQIIGGRLYCPSNWPNQRDPIQYGRGIYVAPDYSTTDANYFTGGNTAAVKRVYRRWGSYFVETETSTYEVFPY